jgi:myo-inositol 2-dehydrogenase/D-chiro-inositol 1-dehydrogenase
MRVAIFGAGRIGPLHGRTLLSSAAIESVSITDLVPQRAADVAAELGLEHVGAVDAAMEQADAVVIAASTTDHAALIRAAIERKLPTFCEKPLAASLEESIAVMLDVEASAVPFHLGFQRRFDPAHVEARRLVESGEIGDIHSISMRCHDPAPASEAYVASSGGMFRDQSTHDLDALRFLTALEAEEVYCLGNARGFPLYETYQDYANAVAVIKLADGTPVTATWARHDPLGHDVRTEIFGSRDSVAVGLGPRTPLRSLETAASPSGGPPWRDFLDRWAQGYQDELIAFVDVARGERVSPCTARDGVEALRLASALALSAREGRVVDLSEVPGR